MALATELGKLNRDEDLRSVWPDEPGDFTPWLAENIDLLGEALNMAIQIEGREISVGSFSVDLVGREIGTDRVVIIENQLSRTDHGHLGQLLAYRGWPRCQNHRLGRTRGAGRAPGDHSLAQQPN